MCEDNEKHKQKHAQTGLKTEDMPAPMRKGKPAINVTLTETQIWALFAEK